MNQILEQLGELVLGAVPTMLFLVFLVIAYGFLVRRPLAKVLAERRARTVGAMEQARAAIAAAESETAAYEEKLRRAKAEIFALRESRLKQWRQERDHAIEEARRATGERILKGRAEIEQAMAIARRQIEGISEELSDQILRTMMRPGSQPEAAQ
ncbi:MAG: hypothetical protein M3O02_12170 [Acidobacteriota bacterium]|nr:hypothetical protein [Acidobacteriota bacterium]